ncbi:MAG: hypothetical protein R2695_16305 [Acidimicrobiales bacterium]
MRDAERRHQDARPRVPDLRLQPLPRRRRRRVEGRGLGVLGAVAHTPEGLDIDLQWIEDEIGDKPYGVDLIIPAKYPLTRPAATRPTTSSP